jgi:diadenosine tetraphosphate (Ap4A) HIT family hydrolase
LIITKRHVADYFSLTKLEKQAIDDALIANKQILDEKLKPSGYNIGINNGKSAGQTVMHLHVHLIPRFEGDVKDPTGGVRGVIFEKQKY